MIIIPTESEYMLSKSRLRKKYARIVLLNQNFKEVDVLDGVVIEEPTFNIDNNSNIRRTCNITITPTDKSFDIKKGNKIWLDKYVQIYIGYSTSFNKEITYTNMGIYMINNPSRVYSATDNTITIQGIDLMAKLTGQRNGNLMGLTYTIPKKTNIREGIIGVLELFGFKKYIVEDSGFTTYEINIEAGGTAYEILIKLKEMFPNYQMYFDVNGVFHYDKIPSGKYEPIVADDDLWKDNLISYQEDIDFESIKNSVEVFGGTHEIKNYGGTVTESQIEDNTYKINISTVDSLSPSLQFGFTTQIDVGSPKYLQITFSEDNIVKYPIKNEDGTTPTFNTENEKYQVVSFTKEGTEWNFINTDYSKSNILTATISQSNVLLIGDIEFGGLTDGICYTFRTPKSGCEDIYEFYFQINNSAIYPISESMKIQNDTVYTIRLDIKENEQYFKYLGEVTPYAKVEETDYNNPFSIYGSLGVVNKVLSGGEYDNIYNNELALERAKWELYQCCRLKDTVSLTCIPIYWLDVNTLIEITLPNKYGEEKKDLYMIQSINIGQTMTINLSKYYPYYDEE